MTTTDAEAIARIIRLAMYDSSASEGPDELSRIAGTYASAILSYLASRREAQEPVAPFAENGYGSRLLREAVAYLNEYVFDFDSGADHEPTEFERFMMEDMLNGLFSHEPFFGIIRNLAATPAPADDLVARLKRLEIEAADLNYKLVPEPVPERGPDAPVPAPAGEVERLCEALEQFEGRIKKYIVQLKATGQADVAHLLRRDVDCLRVALNGGREKGK